MQRNEESPRQQVHNLCHARTLTPAYNYELSCRIQKGWIAANAAVLLPWMTSIWMCLLWFIGLIDACAVSIPDAYLGSQCMHLICDRRVQQGYEDIKFMRAVDSRWASDAYHLLRFLQLLQYCILDSFFWCIILVQHAGILKHILQTYPQMSTLRCQPTHSSHWQIVFWYLMLLTNKKSESGQSFVRINSERSSQVHRCVLSSEVGSIP